MRSRRRVVPSVISAAVSLRTAKTTTRQRPSQRVRPATSPYDPAGQPNSDAYAAPLRGRPNPGGATVDPSTVRVQTWRCFPVFSGVSRCFSVCLCSRVTQPLSHTHLHHNTRVQSTFPSTLQMQLASICVCFLRRTCKRGRSVMRSPSTPSSTRRVTTGTSCCHSLTRRCCTVCVVVEVMWCGWCDMLCGGGYVVCGVQLLS